MGAVARLPVEGWFMSSRSRGKFAPAFPRALICASCQLRAARCQWLEEALVEAFSLRGLTLLADSRSTDPPFKDDSGFGAAVAVYRQNIVERYGKLAVEQGNPKDCRAWFAQHRAELES